MKFKILSIFIIFISIFFTACENKPKEEIKKVEEFKKYSLKTTDNSTINITLKDNKILLENSDNKIVLLNFFTTWCPACKAQFSNLVKLQDIFQNDIIIVGVLLEDLKSDEELLQFITKYDINHPITNSSNGIELAKELGGIKAIPKLFILDKEGNIFETITGISPTEMLDIKIKKLLER
ncbi:TlpA family protein disulfide reductase [Aliarcobacter skirrowii]|jgi:thiol-disulfide isomerase/thioredoxin|uniref:TlpA family protein disulfide reductase n=1 Tax=Aliarcobacter skirrowii TaxID=28200 RepID=UPI00082B24C5|nr:TlpA disulfide reductase family protein [Aliarcobacter skirrowii]MDX4027846.1 TlpA disulfide reductase family protein [Aliarcobacter skirrowii]PWE20324.1 TlpA family protein disulfide reductase [Aliarcobacter skirrowii]PWE25320.1 TlpA family protein disulfide reductase [Aliarcobacter skirrowii]RJO55655.1 TlpA family protein disulfide reductase [Aliarcobacter skirrowii]RJO57611.1 TlpA family protein disulfide reductase [Aliarcobacter skirrowii]